MPYATAKDILDRIDSRWLRQLILDNNTVATEEQFLASTRVAAALSDAAGRILASCLQGKRYSKADLDGLTGDGASLLVWLNVNIAAGNLAAGRQIPAEKIAETIPMYGQALALLEQTATRQRGVRCGEGSGRRSPSHRETESGSGGVRGSAVVRGRVQGRLLSYR